MRADCSRDGTPEGTTGNEGLKTGRLKEEACEEVDSLKDVKKKGTKTRCRMEWKEWVTQ